MQSTSRLILPKPTYTLPDPSKKSHARKQPAGHIPRPRNAFILFRCDFVRQKKIPESVETDHRNISRIVGRIWREMTDLEREPWVRMADEEKTNHMKIHPGYRFTRGSPAGKRKGKREEGFIRSKPDDLTSLSIDEVLLALERAASCPPGALHVPTVNLEASTGYGSPMKVRDDLERRPSRVTLYQSTPHDPQEDSGSGFFTDIINQQYYAESLREQSMKAKGPTAEQSMKKEICDDADPEGTFCGPRLCAMRYPIPDINVPPEWESNAPAGVWHGWRQDSNLFDGSSNNAEGYARMLPPVFTDPFSVPSTLPPLPRSGLPFYPLEEDRPTSPVIAENKTSAFFSPRTGTWRLPAPVINTSPDLRLQRADDHVSDTVTDDVPARLSNFRRSLDLRDNISSGSKSAHDVADEVFEELSRHWLSDTSDSGEN